MAGYIFNLSNMDSLRSCVTRGVYATVLSHPKILRDGGGIWRTPNEGTFCDYATMREGDNVYFFIDRKIYGIGKLNKIADQDCKFCNYPDASSPAMHSYKDKKPLMLLQDQCMEDKTQRWICTFAPDPYFFMDGVDMDDALSSNPEAFNMLRAFWNLSFVKIDDDENQALKDVLLRNNQIPISNPQPNINIFENKYTTFHQTIATKVAANNYKLDVTPILKSCHDDKYIRHEMAIEAALLFQLSEGHQPTIDVFGNWDYLAHQVVASPFKPIDYMDKMDVFGYSYISGYNPTKSKYLVIELKKDKALQEDIEQLMKYVDWVREKYCHGDYSMIDAYLVTFDFSQDVIEYSKNNATRRYIVGRRPPKSELWSNVGLIKYSYNESTGLVDFIPA